MDPWTLQGTIFAILGRPGRRSFFDAFFDRQKVIPKSQKSAKLVAKRRPAAKKKRPPAKNGVARRNARGRRGRIWRGAVYCIKLHEVFCRMLKTVDFRSARLLPSAGGGGSLTRIPPGQGFEEMVCGVVGSWLVL